MNGASVLASLGLASLAGCATLDDRLLDRASTVLPLVDSGEPRLAHRPIVVAKIDGREGRFVVDTGAPLHGVAAGPAHDAAPASGELWRYPCEVEVFEGGPRRSLCASLPLGPAGVPVSAGLAGVVSPFELAGPGRATVLDLPRERVLTTTFARAMAVFGGAGRRLTAGALPHCSSVVRGVDYRRPLVVGTVGGREGRLLVDTGGHSSLWLGRPLAGLDPPQDSTTGPLEARFGEVSFVARFPLARPPWREGCEPDGLLGPEHLARCVIVVDERRFFVACEGAGR